MSELVLKGIDGANPLGFLTAVGTVVMTKQFCPAISMGWQRDFGSWRPFLFGYEGDEAGFSENLSVALSNTSSEPFEFDKKLPFSALRFAEILKTTAKRSKPRDRRTADLLCAFGSEIREDEVKENFQDTLFRMVRSGDSAGQGFPFYAISIRNSIDKSVIFRTLFKQWDYKDKGFSLRWDPMEDQRYALRWHDPSKNKDVYAPGTMNGANTLAIEALSLFPTIPLRKNLTTTGFYKDKQRRIHFTWPIWDKPIFVETIRSLISMQDLQEETPLRKNLHARGIIEIYRCERIAPNQYYRNFAPAVPA